MCAEFEYSNKINGKEWEVEYTRKPEGFGDYIRVRKDSDIVDCEVNLREDFLDWIREINPKLANEFEDYVERTVVAEGLSS